MVFRNDSRNKSYEICIVQPDAYVPLPLLEMNFGKLLSFQRSDEYGKF